MSLDALTSLLKGSTNATVERDFPLARLTTYKLGGPADLYFEPHDAGDLEFLGRAIRGSGLEVTPILALGRGSNVVISDEGWQGIVVRLGPAFSWIEGSAPGAEGAGPTAPGGAVAIGGEDREFQVGGSTPLPLVANWAARRALSGLEFAVAIPGSVGGAVRMNAGAHGGSVGDCLVSVRLFDLDILELEERSSAGLELAYRTSNLTERQLVLDARFRLAPGDAQTIKATMDSYRRHRADTQPGALSNAGSVFKNPPGDSAGRLVDSAGLKGFRVGDAWVSELHANFFMAGPRATAQDVYDLVHEVRARVRAALGVELEPEVRFVGSFRRQGAMS